MKKILVPTDFSAPAYNALQYAAHIANIFESSIHLVHAYSLHLSPASLMSIKNLVEADAERNLQETVERIKPSLKEGVQITFEAVLHSPIPYIAKLASGFDLIVMGTQGASGLKEVFIGSTTAGVMSRTEVPLLAIPSQSKFKPIQSILLAVDNHPMTSSDILAPVKKIAQASEATLTLFHLEREGQYHGIDPGITEYFRDFSLHLYNNVEPVDKEINTVINKILQERKIDLVCMVRRKRDHMEEVFHTSVTLKEVLNSPVPLFVLRDKK